MRIALAALILACATHPAQTQTFTTIHNFTGASADGFSPYSPLVRSGKVLYGTTLSGGAYNSGAVFSLAPPTSPGEHWTEKILYSFTGGLDGAGPEAGLVIVGEVLYGATNRGGAANLGTAYSLTPPQSPGGPWTETVLHSFGKEKFDGTTPAATLVLGSRGTLYGTTAGGGRHNGGTVFQLSPPKSPGGMWTEQILDTFVDGPRTTGVAIDLVSGILYGTIPSGGSQAQGSIFSLTPPAVPGAAWTESEIYSFTGDSDGGEPNTILLAPSGVLYGASHGLHSHGAAFSLAPPAVPGAAWIFTILHEFKDSPDVAIVFRRARFSAL